MKKSDNEFKKQIITNLIISLISGIIAAIIGSIFSFWLTKTYGFPNLGGMIYG